jgi:hypothetical protein
LRWPLHFERERLACQVFEFLLLIGCQQTNHLLARLPTEIGLFLSRFAFDFFDLGSQLLALLVGDPQIPRHIPAQQRHSAALHPDLCRQLVQPL